MSTHLISKALITEIDIIPNLLSIKDYPKVITNAEVVMKIPNFVESGNLNS